MLNEAELIRHMKVLCFVVVLQFSEFHVGHAQMSFVWQDVG